MRTGVLIPGLGSPAPQGVMGSHGTPHMAGAAHSDSHTAVVLLRGAFILQFSALPGFFLTPSYLILGDIDQLAAALSRYISVYFSLCIESELSLIF